MSYILKDCSSQARRLVAAYAVRVNKPDRELIQDIRTPFPFKAMEVGQSFYMERKDICYHDEYLVKKRVRDYNKKFRTEFKIVDHGDKLEIVRVG